MAVSPLDAAARPKRATTATRPSGSRCAQTASCVPERAWASSAPTERQAMVAAWPRALIPCAEVPEPGLRRQRVAGDRVGDANGGSAGEAWSHLQGCVTLTV
jgi:hypothetical protein